MELCKIAAGALQIPDEGAFRDCLENHLVNDSVSKNSNILANAIFYLETDCYMCLCTTLGNQGTPCSSDSHRERKKIKQLPSTRNLWTKSLKTPSGEIYCTESMPLCPFLVLFALFCPFMPLYAPLCPFMPLYTPLYLFTSFYVLYTLYKLSSFQDLIAGFVLFSKSY